MSKTMKQSFLLMDEDDEPIAVVMKLELVPSAIFNHEISNGNTPQSSVSLSKSKSHYDVHEAEYTIAGTGEFLSIRKRAYIAPITFFDDGSGSCPNESAPIDYVHKTPDCGYIKHNGSGGQFVIVPVPDNASNPVAVINRKSGWSARWLVGKERVYVKVPCIAANGYLESDITEHGAAQIVTNEGITDKPSYTNYLFPFSGFSTAKESLKSLLLSHGIEGRAIIFKIIE